jgi:hypothetical protein
MTILNIRAVRDLPALANRFSCAIIEPEEWLQTLAKL